MDKEKDSIQKTIRSSNESLKYIRMYIDENNLFDDIGITSLRDKIRSICIELENYKDNT